jgi:hypothetical protein
MGTQRNRTKPIVLREVEGPVAIPLPSYPLLIVPESGLVTFCITSPRLEKYATHWSAAAKHPVWCPGPADCVHCEEGWEARVVAYACCLATEKKRPYLVGIPQSAWLHCAALVQHDGDLRGRTWSMQRLTRSKHGPIKVIALPVRIQEASLPSPFSIREEVGRRFGIRTSAEETPEYEG